MQKKYQQEAFLDLHTKCPLVNPGSELQMTSSIAAVALVFLAIYNSILNIPQQQLSSNQLL